jgi:hypothetical protein
VSGLLPERFREIRKQDGERSKKEITRSLFAFKVIEKFYKSVKDILELSALSDNEWYMGQTEENKSESPSFKISCMLHKRYHLPKVKQGLL